MPQMSPMDWLFLNMYFIMLYIFVLMILYFYMYKFFNFCTSSVILNNYIIKWY